MEEFVYTVLYRKQILSGEKGLYQFIPCYIIKGFYDTKENVFLDEMNKIRYLLEDSTMMEDQSEYGVGKIYTEQDLCHQYPDARNLDEAKLRLFEEEENILTIGIYQEDKDQIKVLKYSSDKLEYSSFEELLKQDEKEVETFDFSNEDTVILPHHIEELMKIDDTSLMYQFLRSLKNNRTKEEQQIKKLNHGSILNFESKDIDKLIDEKYSCDEIKSYFQEICDFTKSLLEEYADNQILDLEESDLSMFDDTFFKSEDEQEEMVEYINVFDIDSLLNKMEDIKNKIFHANHLEEVKEILNQAIRFYQINLSTIEMLRDTDYRFFQSYHYFYLQTEYLNQLLKLDNLDKIKRKYLFLHYQSKKRNIPKIKYELECEVENIEKEQILKESLHRLNQLVGLENVKTTFEDLFSSILFKNKTSEDLVFENESKHMAFLGNPGTGKTTVAEIIAPMLHKLGYVRNNKVAYVAAEDLVASYVGQTAIKTKELIAKNKGGIIIVDEAYILSSSAQKFGNEAITVILKEMEKNDTLFIFAGYEKEMEDFIKMNSGLKSRICSYIHFEDYSEKELLTMFMNRLKNTSKKNNKHKLMVTVEAMEKVRDMIKEGMQQEDFGNGRFVKNLFDQVITAHAKNKKDDFALDRFYQITKEDIPDHLLDKILYHEKNTSDYKATTIGFGAKIKTKSRSRNERVNR